MQKTLRDLPNATFEFPNRICLLRGWRGGGGGVWLVKANMLRIAKLGQKSFIG